MNKLNKYLKGMQNEEFIRLLKNKGFPEFPDNCPDEM